MRSDLVVLSPSVVTTRKYRLLKYTYDVVTYIRLSFDFME